MVVQLLVALLSASTCFGSAHSSLIAKLSSAQARASASALASEIAKLQKIKASKEAADDLFTMQDLLLRLHRDVADSIRDNYFQAQSASAAPSYSPPSYSSASTGASVQVRSASSSAAYVSPATSASVAAKAPPLPPLKMQPSQGSSSAVADFLKRFESEINTRVYKTPPPKAELDPQDGKPLPRDLSIIIKEFLSLNPNQSDKAEFARILMNGTVATAQRPKKFREGWSDALGIRDARWDLTTDAGLLLNNNVMTEEQIKELSTKMGVINGVFQ